MDFSKLVARFRGDGVTAIALAGSFARGDAGKFSDVDLICFRDANSPTRDAETDLIDQRFVVANHVTPTQVADWFSLPDEASAWIAGIRSACPLWDPQGDFAAIQQRANDFVWDDAMQAQANAWASAQMVGWIEEAQKGLAGLRRNDEGRLLNARYGLSWGLLNVMRVQRGVLISSDNRTYAEVVQSLGCDSDWARLSRQTFGVAGNASLREQVAAGLQLYLLTAELLAEAIQPEHGPLIEAIVCRIGSEMNVN